MYEEMATAQNRPELLRYIEPFFSGTVTYRALVPVEVLTKNYGGKEHPAMRDPKMVRNLALYAQKLGVLIHVIVLWYRAGKQ